MGFFVFSDPDRSPPEKGRFFCFYPRFAWVSYAFFRDIYKKVYFFVKQITPIQLVILYHKFIIDTRNVCHFMFILTNIFSKKIMTKKYTFSNADGAISFG